MPETIYPERVELGPGEYVTWFEPPDPWWASLLRRLQRPWLRYVGLLPPWLRARWVVHAQRDNGQSSTGFWTRRDAVHYAAGLDHTDDEVHIRRD